MNAPLSLRMALAKRGFKQSKLCEMTGMSSTAVSRLTTHPNWTCGSLQRVSDALGMKVSDFVKLGEE